MQLKSPRIRLEPLEVRHAADLFQGLSDVRLYQFISDSPPSSLEWLQQRYSRLSRRKSPDNSEDWLNWALWSELEARYVGYVQATVEIRMRHISIAYVIFSDYWGQGYGTEAVTSMITFLKNRYASFTIAASTEEGNARSISLLRRLGFVQVSNVEERHGISQIEFLMPSNAEDASLLP